MTDKNSYDKDGNRIPKKHYIDNFLFIDAKKKEITFEAPASELFEVHENKKEVKDKWLKRI